MFVFGFGKSQLAHGIPGKWLIESPDYGKVGEFFRGSLVMQRFSNIFSRVGVKDPHKNLGERFFMDYIIG
ncbi:MAG: hypothetical protein ACJAUE_003070 [Alcanivorax sp.]